MFILDTTKKKKYNLFHRIFVCPLFTLVFIRAFPVGIVRLRVRVRVHYVRM